MDLTVVIPFFEGHDTIQSLLSSIPSGFPVIIVDDQSTTPLSISRDNVRVIRSNKKGYFSGAVNLGISDCSTDVLIVNQDIEFKGNSAFELIEHYQSEYATIGESISGVHPAWSNGYIHGTFMYMRRDAIRSVGLLNDEFYPLWGSTCEWQLRACRKGFKALPVIPVPGMTHKRKGGFGSAILKILEKEPRKKELLIRTPPLISVVVPAYNHGKYLHELINSLIGGETALGMMPGQTFQSFDIIIADDCSTDNTEQVMKNLVDPWKGIKYVKTKTNSGTSAACNVAVKASTAKYIARIDADDMREFDSLEKMLRAQLKNEHSFVYDDVQLFSENARMPKPWKMREYDFDELIIKNFIHAGIMFPRKAWEEVGGYPEEMRWGRDDWAFNIALGLKGWCGVRLANPGYLYRRHGNNRTIRNTNPRDREKFKQQIMTLYPEAYKEVRPMACCGGRGRARGSQTYARANGGGVAASPTPGAEGLTLVEYQGLNVGEETYFGAVTGSAYTFSAKNRRKWVDPRDLHVETAGGQEIGLLDLTKHGKYLFKVFRQPVQSALQRSAEIVREMKTRSEEPSVAEEMTETLSADLPDDYFTGIKGIGVATSKKLIANGYTSLHQLSEADTDALMDAMGWSADKAIDIQKQAGKLE